MPDAASASSGQCSRTSSESASDWWRVNAPISTAELERRWRAVRAAMTEQRIDALVMQANNDFMGGYVKYFTDVPATNGYWASVVFPKDERMTEDTLLGMLLVTLAGLGTGTIAWPIKRIERLKSEWTDKYVVVDARAPELARFARATGQLAKTDTLDAQVIARFAEAVRPVPRPVPDEQAQALGPERVRDLLKTAGVFRRHPMVAYLSGYTAEDNMVNAQRR